MRSSSSFSATAISYSTPQTISFAALAATGDVALAGAVPPELVPAQRMAGQTRDAEGASRWRTLPQTRGLDMLEP